MGGRIHVLLHGASLRSESIAIRDRGGTITILQERQAVERQLLTTLPFRVEVFGNEDFSEEVRQAWLEQLIQTYAGMTSSIDG